jgi:hypothetical protein
MNRYITILCLSIFLFSASPVLPQSHPNSLYVELLGNGGLYSINYDRLFTSNIGGRIGFSYLSFKKDLFLPEMTLFTFPVSFSYLLGEGSSKLELGAGITIVSGEFDWVNEKGSGGLVVPNLIFGYRFQSSDGGFLFRIGYIPLFTSEGVLSWVGLSMGATF